MISATAKLRTIKAPSVNGIGNVRENDNNCMRLSLKIVSGPQAWIDRILTSDIGITEFVSRLPKEVAVRLLEVLQNDV